MPPDAPAAGPSAWTKSPRALSLMTRILRPADDRWRATSRGRRAASASRSTNSENSSKALNTAACFSNSTAPMLARRLRTTRCPDATAGVSQDLHRIPMAVASPADDSRIDDQRRHRMTGRKSPNVGDTDAKTSLIRFEPLVQARPPSQAIVYRRSRLRRASFHAKKALRGVPAGKSPAPSGRRKIAGLTAVIRLGRY